MREAEGDGGVMHVIYAAEGKHRKLPMVAGRKTCVLYGLDNFYFWFHKGGFSGEQGLFRRAREEKSDFGRGNVRSTS